MTDEWVFNINLLLNYITVHLFGLNNDLNLDPAAASVLRFFLGSAYQSFI